MEKRFLYIASVFVSVIYFSLIYFYGEDNYLAFFSDDFYYYLVTAKNTLKYGFVTFNGIVETNGFHPLWFLVILVLTALFGSELSVFISVSIISAFLSVYVFRLASIIIGGRAKSEKTSGWSFFGGFLIMLVYMTMSRTGMEVILIVPLLLWIIKKSLSGEKTALFFSIVSSLTLLSRLDSAFFIFPLLGLLVFRKRLDIRFAIIPLLVLLLYILSNYLIFDTFMPVSGMAKQLKNSLLPVIEPIKFMYWFSNLDRIYVLLQLLVFAINLIILMFYWGKGIKRDLLWLSIGFPIVLILYNNIFSGWILWAWYYYMFVPSTVMFFVILHSLLGDGIISKKGLGYLGLMLVVSYIIYQYNRYNPDENYIFQSGKQIAEYLNDKEGVVAMGDRAGIVSYLIDNPVIQMEGLVMDKDYLEDIRSYSLVTIMKKYNVSYYVANDPIRLENGWSVSEPYPHHQYIITAKDTIKTEPIEIVDLEGWVNPIFYISDIKVK